MAEFEYAGFTYKIELRNGKPFLINNGVSKELFTEDKIYNPSSKKYVNLTGPTGKDLMKNKIISDVYKNMHSVPRVSRVSVPASIPVHVPEVKIFDQKRAANLDDIQLTVNNIAHLSPSDTISTIFTKGDPQTLINLILNYTGFIPSLKVYEQKLLALSKNAMHTVTKISDSDTKVRENPSETDERLGEYTKLFQKSMSDEGVDKKEETRMRWLVTVLKEDGFSKDIDKIRKNFAFGTTSSKFYRAKRSSKKGLIKLKTFRNMGTRKGKSKKKSKKKSTRSKFGRIYGLQDSPGYTGVWPLARGPPARVPLDYLGNPANTVDPYLPNLNNVVRDYTNTGPSHGQKLFNFGLNQAQMLTTTKVNPRVMPKVVMPRPIAKSGY